MRSCEPAAPRHRDRRGARRSVCRGPALCLPGPALCRRVCRGSGVPGCQSLYHCFCQASKRSAGPRGKASGPDTKALSGPGHRPWGLRRGPAVLSRALCVEAWRSAPGRDTESAEPSLCQRAPELSGASGALSVRGRAPGALCVRARRSAWRGPALFVSGPGRKRGPGAESCTSGEGKSSTNVVLPEKENPAGRRRRSLQNCSTSREGKSSRPRETVRSSIKVVLLETEIQPPAGDRCSSIKIREGKIQPAAGRSSTKVVLAEKEIQY